MSEYKWKPFTLLVSADEVKGNEMKIGDKYSFIGKEIVGERFFTDGKRYSLKSFNGNGEPILIDDTDNDHPWSIEAFNECFKKVEEGPIRTVKRREIVAGSYGVIQVHKDGKIGMLPSVKSPEQLREAAHLLNQIAEVLEENGE